MKVTIDLSKEQVLGIIDYLSSTGDENPTKDDVKTYIQGVVYSVISSPNEAVSDYISKHS